MLGSEVGNDVLSDVAQGLKLRVLGHGAHLADEENFVDSRLLEAGDVADRILDRSIMQSGEEKLQDITLWLKEAEDRLDPYMSLSIIKLLLKAFGILQLLFQFVFASGLRQAAPL